MRVLPVSLWTFLKFHRSYYVEIKCQLDATDEFLLQILLLAQHVSGTIMPIIRSSTILYKWLLPVVFGVLKMENVICNLGRFWVSGIKCRVLYMFCI